VEGTTLERIESTVTAVTSKTAGCGDVVLCAVQRLGKHRMSRLDPKKDGMRRGASACGAEYRREDFELDKVTHTTE